jgi:uncharacterized protein (DUF362 family)
MVDTMENRVGIRIRKSDPKYAGSTLYQDENLRAEITGALGEYFLGDFDAENPFAGIIEPGMTVLVKPNWVIHKNYSGMGNECLVTHPAFILAVLKEVFKSRPGRVIIGDAPIQECVFDAVVSREWKKNVCEIAGCPVEIADFRRTVLREGGLAAGQEQEMRGEENYVLFDLGTASLLEPVSEPNGRFRITCYDPDTVARHHRSGTHQYLLCREPFDADVILNLPKLKTHKKAGITAALKNIVGLNGNKEFLPHHRLGGSAEKGDCYPGFSSIKKLAEWCLDKANRSIGKPAYSSWIKGCDTLLKIQAIHGNPEIEGSWYGNDTVWRMTLDINRLLLYGRSDGTLSETPLRKVYSITDALVAGEGDGPLAPEPVNMGAVTFASSSVFSDLAHTALMRFDFEKIPCIREAFGNFRYPLTELSPDSCLIGCNGKTFSLYEFSREYGRDFKPPAGWKDHVEKGAEE